MKRWMAMAAGLSLLASAPGRAAAQAEDFAALEAVLAGTWFAVDLDTSAPLRRGPGTGLDACHLPLDGPVGGDLSFRRKDGGWEWARLGGPFRKADVGRTQLGGRTLLRVGDQSIKAVKAAADGTPRIFTYTGDPDDEVEVSFQKCPAR
jgi:hypothetical protein